MAEGIALDLVVWQLYAASAGYLVWATHLMDAQLLTVLLFLWKLIEAKHSP